MPLRRGAGLAHWFTWLAGGAKSFMAMLAGGLETS